ncbi:MAG TPA: AMP-binding protein, partial [Polyangiales bacterium]
MQDGESKELTTTFGSLLQRASALSGALAARVPAGGRVVLMLPPSGDFFPIFWACLHAGVIPCVVYPPARIAPAELAPVAAICRDARASLLITTQAIQEAMQDLSPAACASLQLPPICGWEGLEGKGTSGVRRSCDIAYLQYTSGSTSAPKGVRITHRGLAEHLEHLCARFAYTSESIAVSWLPVHHSFGLVAGVLIPVFAGCVSISMSPGHFLERPLRWLEAIDRYRATHSGGPNFAYDLASAKLAGGEATRPLDLSCWRLAGTGGEAVQHGTMERFQSELAKVGMPRTAFAPAYGLSEATLVVSTSPYQEQVVLTLDGAALQRGEVAPCSADTSGARTMVSVGRLVAGFELKLVDPTTQRP